MPGFPAASRAVDDLFVALREAVAGTSHAVGTLQKGIAMIQGLITSKDVLWRAGTIVRSFGVRRYLRCICALLSGRRTTFLELMWPGR
jgi:hypothetical protein